MRRAVPICIAVFATVAVGCGGGDDDGGGGGAGATSGETLTVWNNEFQPDRMKATQAILDDFTKETGIKTKLVAVPEDQLATLMTNAAAADELPDVVLATPLDQSQQYAQEEIFDSEAAQAVVDSRPQRRLGPAADLPQGPVRQGRPGRAADARRRARGR
jgi:multiple sugar transport system substrate-binding protein